MVLIDHTMLENAPLLLRLLFSFLAMSEFKLDMANEARKAASLEERPLHPRTSALDEDDEEEFKQKKTASALLTTLAKPQQQRLSRNKRKRSKRESSATGKEDSRGCDPGHQKGGDGGQGKEQSSKKNQKNQKKK